MVGCSAKGCLNRSENGFIMKYFPKDEKRRKEWTINMQQENWVPTDRTVLCEVHFAPEMWEKTREDGKRKLKLYAVPTLFQSSTQLIEEMSTEEIVEEKEDIELKQSVVMQQSNSSSELLAECSTDSSNSSSEAVPAFSSVNVKELTSKLEKREEFAEKLFKRNINLKRKLMVTQRQVRYLKKQNEELQNTDKYLPPLQQIFGDDQIYAIKNTPKFMKWTDDTITKALQLKFSCGNGYNELLRQKYPLPSVKTLARRLEDLKFSPGILHEVFDLLKVKVESFEEHEKFCVLLLGEMAISPGLMYDNSATKFIGDVTLPEQSNIASNALVLMLGGVTSRWEQTVAYYFTGESSDGTLYEKIIFEVIEKAENLGLQICSITSDMGPSIMALWKKWNIVAGQNKETNNFINHPFDSTRKIFVLADVSRLFKDIKKMFVSNLVIYVSNDIKNDYSLATNEICVDHINDLIHHQKDLRYSLEQKTAEEGLLPDNFKKTRVRTSKAFDVASGLRFISEALKKPEYNTTAWFVDLISKWFYYMLSRHSACALSKFNEPFYEEAIKVLNSSVNVFSQLYIDDEHKWEPLQTGLIVTTASMLNLQNYFLNQKKLASLLTSPFTLDYLESLFSAIRVKQVAPTADQFKNNLRSISVSQYLKNVSRTNYV